MLRRAFLRRMAFAALATWFLDLPLPKEPRRHDDGVARWMEVHFPLADGRTLSVQMTGTPVQDLDVGDFVSYDIKSIYGYDTLGPGVVQRVHVAATGVRTPAEMRALA